MRGSGAVTIDGLAYTYPESGAQVLKNLGSECVWVAHMNEETLMSLVE